MTQWEWLKSVVKPTSGLQLTEVEAQPWKLCGNPDRTGNESTRQEL